MKWMLGGMALAGMAVAASAQGAVRRPEDRQPRPGQYWTWEELTVSAAATRLHLVNTPGPAARANLQRMCAAVLDPLRARWPTVRVNSAFRSPAVNRAVGGVEDSRHLVGLAADLAVPLSQWHAVRAWLRARGVKVLEYSGHMHVELL